MKLILKRLWINMWLYGWVIIVGIEFKREDMIELEMKLK